MPRADHTDTTIAISRYNCADQIPKGKQTNFGPLQITA
jgi:hypothetical protein